MIEYRKNSPYPDSVGGFVVPKEFLIGCTLVKIERILGFRSGRLMQGAIFVQLESLPKIDELEYYGDTRSPAHSFEENRNKEISKRDLNNAAYHYFQPTAKLIKVIPLDDSYSKKPENQYWPAGQGAMQYKLKFPIKKRAIIIDVVKDYPNGVFGGL